MKLSEVPRFGPSRCSSMSPGKRCVQADQRIGSVRRSNDIRIAGFSASPRVNGQQKIQTLHVRLAASSSLTSPRKEGEYSSKTCVA